MSNNPLLLTWVKNKEDDASPYYYSKLDFLQIYGKKCVNQNKYGECFSATTEDECKSNRELKCEYTNGQCVKIVDSICTYYSEDGNPEYQKWNTEQVEYIDNLYKLAVSFEYGKFMSGENYTQTVKTNGFQQIYSKFNLTLDSVKYNKKGCYYMIISKLKTNENFINQIKEHRMKAYTKLYPQLKIKSNEEIIIKPVEISLYIFELLRSKHVEYNLNDIFYHEEEIDEEIYQILNKKGICINGDNFLINNNVKEISLNINDLSSQDFEYNENIEGSGILWKLSNSVFRLLNTLTYNASKPAMTLFKCIYNTKYYINETLSKLSEWGIILLLLFLVIDLILESVKISIESKPVSFEENPLLFIINQYVNYFSFLKGIPMILPYLRTFQLILSSFICILIPITNLSYFEELFKELFNENETVQKTGNYMYNKMRNQYSVSTILKKDENMNKINIFIKSFIKYSIQELYEGILETQINCNKLTTIISDTNPPPKNINLNNIPNEYILPMFTVLKNGFENLNNVKLQEHFLHLNKFANELITDNTMNVSSKISKLFGIFENIFIFILKKIMNQPTEITLFSNISEESFTDNYNSAKELFGYIITSIQLFFTSSSEVNTLTTNNYLIYKPITLKDFYELLLEKNVFLSVGLFLIIYTYKHKDKYEKFIRKNIFLPINNMTKKIKYTKSVKSMSLKNKQYGRNVKSMSLKNKTNKSKNKPTIYK